MRIAAFDMASKTGYAIIENGKVIRSGMKNLTKKRGENNGTFFLKFRAWLHNEIGNYGPFAAFAYEQAHFQGGSTTEMLLGLQVHLQSYAAQFELPVAPYHTGTIKKFITGKGNASKEDVILAVEFKTGITPKDDNEADAIAVGLLAWSDLGVVENKEEDPF